MWDLIGTGVAVTGGGIEGIGTLGIAMAFGLSIVAMAYSIGTISGCHINPAVSVAMFINKRMNAMELCYYVLAQILADFKIVTNVAVTGKKGSSSLAGLVIGFTLVLIHLLGIPLTGTSVNPARSIAPALFVGGEALSQLWVFIVAPILGGIFAAIVGKFILNTEK
ncbi:aquaporin [Bacillus sp. HC-Mk]